jgi:hypothetical protein
MADSKISALPASTTPLAGTEILPIVQSSTTRQVSVANLTAGRAISATQLTLTTGNLIVASGQGIDFSATSGAPGATSELLDDYEEGTWTATIFNGANNATMGAGGTCQYTKIGRLVTLHGYIYTTSLGSVTGSLSISGLPFTPLAGGANYTASAAGFGDSLAVLPGQSVGIRITPGSTNAALFVWNAITGSTAMQDTEWTSNGELMFTATYITAA